MLRVIRNLSVSLIIGSAGSLALASADAAAAASTSPSVATSAPAGASLIKQGEYVARVADCVGCHSVSPDKPFAGGTPLKSAYGTLYGSNITSDSATGIGAWSKADFERALRQGVRKDGAYLYPAMPYTSYTKMTDKDMNALWAYIRAIPPKFVI